MQLKSNLIPNSICTVVVLPNTVGWWIYQIFVYTIRSKLIGGFLKIVSTHTFDDSFWTFHYFLTDFVKSLIAFSSEGQIWFIVSCSSFKNKENYGFLNIIFNFKNSCKIWNLHIFFEVRKMNNIELNEF